MFGNTNKELEEAFNEKSTVSNPVEAVVRCHPDKERLVEIYKVIVEPITGTRDEAESIQDDILQAVMRRNPLDEPHVYIEGSEVKPDQVEYVDWCAETIYSPGDKVKIYGMKVTIDDC